MRVAGRVRHHEPGGSYLQTLNAGCLNTGGALVCESSGLVPMRVASATYALPSARSAEMLWQ